MKPEGDCPWFLHSHWQNPLNADNVVFLAGDGEAIAVYEIVLRSIRSNLQAHFIANTQTYTPVQLFV